MVLADLPVSQAGELDRPLADVAQTVDGVSLRARVAALLGVVERELLVGDEELVAELLARGQPVVLVGALSGEPAGTGAEDVMSLQAAGCRGLLS